MSGEKNKNERPPVGYRFLPSDEEIVRYFLKHKMDGKDYLVNKVVHEIDLCKHEPWDLPSLCANKESDDQIWYFFCRRERNKNQQRRTIKAGYWKSAGQDCLIKNKTGKKVIGTKKTLRFHIGCPPNGKQTEWTIHEYNSSRVLPHQTHFVLCKLMKKNSGKAGALPCNDDEPLRNRPSNNANDHSEILRAKVDQERSVSPNVANSFHKLKMQLLGMTAKEISSFNNGYLNESARLGSSTAFSENEQRLADSFLTFPDENRLSAAPNNAKHENINTSYAQELQGRGFPPEQLQGDSNVQNGHAVVRSNEYQRRQSAALSGTLPSLKHDDNGMEKTVVHCGEYSEEENSSALLRAEAQGSSGFNLMLVSTKYRGEISEEDNSSALLRAEAQGSSTTPGDEWPTAEAQGSSGINFEISAYAQGFAESSSCSSTTGEQKIYFKGHEWTDPDSRGWYRSSCRSQSQLRLSNESDSKIQKPTSIQKKSSDDSGKIKRLLVESENDQKLVVAAARSKLTMNSLIRFETLPTSHRQNQPFVYIANVLVCLVLFVVISREMLNCH